LKNNEIGKVSEFSSNHDNSSSRHGQPPIAGQSKELEPTYSKTGRLSSELSLCYGMG
jgi:hypothetical protein